MPKNKSSIINVDYKLLFGLMVLVMIGQTAFMVAYDLQLDAEGGALVSAHAKTISPSLWQFDAETTLPYLQLAANNENYLKLTVFDNDGDQFLHLTRQYNLYNLVPVQSHRAAIYYAENKIGEIAVEAVRYQFVGVSLLALMVQIGLATALYFFVLLRRSNGRLIGLLDQISHGHQELQHAKELAEDSASARSEFLASMSHELRTPMSGIIGINELLGKTNLTEKQQEYSSHISNSSQVLLSIVNDILDFSKMDSGEVELHLEDFCFSEFIEKVSIPYTLTKNKSVKFIVSVDKNIPEYLTGDPVRLQQIITNLLNNAFKFTEQGSVSLSVQLIKYSGNKVRLFLNVVDTGIGISDENQKVLFNPFKQVDQSSARKFGGTGLGLVICQKLARLMGSDIRLLSKIDDGSSFNFSIELTVPNSNTKKESNSVVEKVKGFSHINVLVAEDNPTNQLIIKALLSRYDMTFVMVDDGQKAVNSYCTIDNTFNLILMDCEMPVVDGYQAVRLIRSWELEQKVKPIPIFALSAHVLPEHIEKSLTYGMNGHLTKPIDIDQLLELITVNVSGDA